MRYPDGGGLDAAERARRERVRLAARVERYTGNESLEVLSCTKYQGFVRSLDYFKNQVFSRNLSGYRVIRRGDIGYPANHVEEGSIGVQEAYEEALVSPIYVVQDIHLTGVNWRPWSIHGRVRTTRAVDRRVAGLVPH